MSDSGHWFDELATRLTRRQTVKAGLAGAAALILPMFRLPAARAEGSGPCYKGCNWTAHQHSEAGNHQCINSALGKYFFRLGFAGVALPVAFVVQAQLVVEGVQCEDKVMLELKEASSACLQANCGGFDPTHNGGPCAACNASTYCCTNQSVDMGYECCSECCSPSGNGCGSGVTECGG
jgi:hypothetical protein